MYFLSETVWFAYMITIAFICNDFYRIEGMNSNTNNVKGDNITIKETIINRNKRQEDNGKQYVPIICANIIILSLKGNVKIHVMMNKLAFC